MSNAYGPVLIVEDVPNVLELLEVTLRFKGYAVVTARNGEEAIEAIKKQRPISAGLSDVRFDRDTEG
jgi:two-component system OmpR family response regulator